MSMLNDKVKTICDNNSEHCGGCPLFETCSMPIEQMKGKNEAERTLFWERKMNISAKKLSMQGA